MALLHETKLRVTPTFLVPMTARATVQVIKLVTNGREQTVYVILTILEVIRSPSMEGLVLGQQAAVEIIIASQTKPIALTTQTLFSGCFE